MSIICKPCACTDYQACAYASSYSNCLYPAKLKIAKSRIIFKIIKSLSGNSQCMGNWWTPGTGKQRMHILYKPTSRPSNNPSSLPSTQPSSQARRALVLWVPSKLCCSAPRGCIRLLHIYLSPKLPRVSIDDRICTRTRWDNNNNE